MTDDMEISPKKRKHSVMNGSSAIPIDLPSVQTAPPDGPPADIAMASPEEDLVLIDPATPSPHQTDPISIVSKQAELAVLRRMDNEKHSAFLDDRRFPAKLRALIWDYYVALCAADPVNDSPWPNTIMPLLRVCSKIRKEVLPRVCEGIVLAQYGKKHKAVGGHRCVAARFVVLEPLSTFRPVTALVFYDGKREIFAFNVKFPIFTCMFDTELEMVYQRDRETGRLVDLVDESLANPLFYAIGVGIEMLWDGYVFGKEGAKLTFEVIEKLVDKACELCVKFDQEVTGG